MLSASAEGSSGNRLPIIAGVYPAREETVGRRGVRVVRQGAERVLRVDDTFASTYQPGRIATGSVWDALACGLLALPLERRGSVLLLGLGGGSAARIARALAPDARIIGVELRAEVVEAARAHLDLDALDLEVVIGDAREVVERFADGSFDAVLEDVFVGRGRGAYKPEGFPFPMLARARACLRPGGLLVTNTLDEAPAMLAGMRELFAHRLEISLADFDNRVFVGSDAPLSGRELRARVARDAALRGSLAQLRFRRL